MAPCSVPSTTLRAGFAGAAMRHHGPHLRAAPTVDPGRDGGMASFSRTSECPVGPSQYRTGFVNLRVALSRKSTCRLTARRGRSRLLRSVGQRLLGRLRRSGGSLRHSQVQLNPGPLRSPATSCPQPRQSCRRLRHNEPTIAALLGHTHSITSGYVYSGAMLLAQPMP